MLCFFVIAQSVLFMEVFSTFRAGMVLGDFFVVSLPVSVQVAWSKKFAASAAFNLDGTRRHNVRLTCEIHARFHAGSSHSVGGNFHFHQ